MSLKDLNEKRNKLVHDAREALDAITANTDEARATELDARHDTIMAEFDKIEKQIEREERTAAIEARFEQRRQERRPISGDGEQRGQDDSDKPEYRHVFAKVVCGGIDDLSPEERAVLKQGHPRNRTAHPDRRHDDRRWLHGPDRTGQRDRSQHAGLGADV